MPLSMWNHICSGLATTNLDCLRYQNQIPTCIIRTGPGVTASGSVLGLISGKICVNRRELMISLTPSQCPNLKTALKHIIRQGTSPNSTGEEDEDMPITRQVGGELPACEEY